VVAAAALLALALLSQGYWTGGFAEGAAARVRVSDDPGTRLAVARMAGEFLARDLVQLTALALLAAAALFALAAGRVRPLLFACIVSLLALVDYYRVDRFILHPERFRNHEGYRIIRDRGAVDRYTTPDDVIEFLRGREGPFRVFPVDDLRNPTTSPAFMSNRYMVFDIASVGGYHPAKLSAYEEFLGAVALTVQEWRLHLLDAVNARYFVAGARLPAHPSLAPVWVGQDRDGNPRAVYENAGALPRAWVVGDYTVATGEQALALLVSGSVDLTRTVILPREPALRPVPGDTARVDVVRSGDHELALAVELDRPGIVVVSEAYYPDWKGTVDGEPAEIMRANHAFRAVALGPGRHEIVMRYDASLVRTGASVSLVALALTVAAAAGSAWRERRRGDKGAGWKRSS
jgi:hypothetical protein